MKTIIFFMLFFFSGGFMMSSHDVYAQKVSKALFAGGCFWCLQPAFDRDKGVVSTTVGYTGGSKPNPSYEEVSSGTTGHVEAIEVTYDPSRVSYEQLLDIFWKSIDPTDPGGQFADQGSQYQTVVYYQNEAERILAEKSRDALSTLGKFDKPIVVRILPSMMFYPAEEYHQKYYVKNVLHYKMYKKGSGREGFLERTWGPEK